MHSKPALGRFAPHGTSLLPVSFHHAPPPAAARRSWRFRPQLPGAKGPLKPAPWDLGHLPGARQSALPAHGVEGYHPVASPRDRHQVSYCCAQSDHWHQPLLHQLPLWHVQEVCSTIQDVLQDTILQVHDPQEAVEFDALGFPQYIRALNGTNIPVTCPRHGNPTTTASWAFILLCCRPTSTTLAPSPM